MRNILKKLTLLLASVLFTFLLVELIFYAWVAFFDISLPMKANRFKESANSAQTFDREKGWVLKPNFKDELHQINSRGLRSSTEFDFNNSEKTKVLVLGDSMAFGMGEVQENIFTEVLNRGNEDYVFINTGVIGYSTWQEYLVLENLVDEVRPDIVLLFYTQSNDMMFNTRDADFYPSVQLEEGEIIRKNASSSFSLPVYEYSNLFRFLNAKFIKNRDFFYIVNRGDFEIRGGDSYIWQVVEKIFGKFENLKNEYGFEMLVFDIPMQNQLNGKFEDRETARTLKGLV